MDQTAESRAGRQCAIEFHRHGGRRSCCGKRPCPYCVRRSELTRVYRILRRLYSKRAFDGAVAYRFGGRWSSPGTRIAYAAEHLSLAMLEYFVHLDRDDPPRDLVLATAQILDGLTRMEVSANQLPANWRGAPAPAELAAIGDAFV